MSANSTKITQARIAVDMYFFCATITISQPVSIHEQASAPVGAGRPAASLHQHSWSCWLYARVGNIADRFCFAPGAACDNLLITNEMTWPSIMTQHHVSAAWLSSMAPAAWLDTFNIHISRCRF
jgi:hypothetical protein